MTHKAVSSSDGTITILEHGKATGDTQPPQKFEVKPVPDHIRDAYEQAQFNLRANEPFLSCILNHIRLGYSPQVDTACVAVQRRGIVLYLSDWFCTLGPAERAFVLKHEALHILQGHIPRSIAYSKVFGPNIHDLLNICQDMAINPDCRALLPPSSKLLPANTKHGGQFCWPELYQMPDDQSFDWYVKQMFKDGNCTCVAVKGKGKGGKGIKGIEPTEAEGEGDGEGEGGGKCTTPPETIEDKWERWTNHGQTKPIDQHILSWDDNAAIEPPTGDAEYDDGTKPLDDAEAAARLNEHILAQAKKEFDETQKGVGNIPGEYSDELEKILSQKPINWLNRLRNTLSQLRGGRKKSTWKKPNRRGFVGVKGTKKGPRAKIFVVVDTSGSVSNKELQMGLAEIDQLSKKEEVYEIQCDTRVTSFRKRKFGDPWNVYGRGGTDLVPGFEKALEEKATAIVCITDGGLFRWPVEPKVPVIWVSTQQQAKYPWGNVVHLTPQGHWWDAPDKDMLKGT